MKHSAGISAISANVRQIAAGGNWRVVGRRRITAADRHVYTAAHLFGGNSGGCPPCFQFSRHVPRRQQEGAAMSSGGYLATRSKAVQRTYSFAREVLEQGERGRDCLSTRPPYDGGSLRSSP